MIKSLQLWLSENKKKSAKLKYCEENLRTQRENLTIFLSSRKLILLHLNESSENTIIKASKVLITFMQIDILHLLNIITPTCNKLYRTYSLLLYIHFVKRKPYYLLDVIS